MDTDTDYCTQILLDTEGHFCENLFFSLRGFPMITHYQGDMEFREFAQFARTRPPQAPTADTQLRTDLKVLSGTRSTRAACSSAFGEAVLQPLTVWRFGAKYFEKGLTYRCVRPARAARVSRRASQRAQLRVGQAAARGRFRGGR